MKFSLVVGTECKFYLNEISKEKCKSRNKKEPVKIEVLIISTIFIGFYISVITGQQSTPSLPEAELPNF